ncbi:hypothetical protein EMIT0P2_110101 [Pseudomonas sp. IT-P2]
MLGTIPARQFLCVPHPDESTQPNHGFRETRKTKAFCRLQRASAQDPIRLTVTKRQPAETIDGGICSSVRDQCLLQLPSDGRR